MYLCYQLFWGQRAACPSQGMGRKIGQHSRFHFGVKRGKGDVLDPNLGLDTTFHDRSVPLTTT